MGMDLVSTRNNSNGEHERYHFNWFGWRRVCVFLDDLGCDLTRFSGSNDGDIVPGRTCRSIANTIRKAWKEDRLKVVYTLEHDQQRNFHYLVSYVFVGDKPNHQKWAAMVSPLTGALVRNENYDYPEGIKALLAEPKQMPLKLAEFQEIDKQWGSWLGRPFELDIIEAVLKDKSPDLSKQIQIDDPQTFNMDDPGFDPEREPFNVLRYYLGFGLFCERCASLRGFRQY